MPFTQQSCPDTQAGSALLWIAPELALLELALLICRGLQHHDVTAEDSQCTLRCLHYPAISLDTPRGSWRAGSHTDFSTLTLLFQVGLLLPLPRSSSPETAIICCLVTCLVQLVAVRQCFLC